MAVLTADAIGRYLGARLGAPVTVEKLKLTFPGASRETWLIQARVRDEVLGFALRVDAPEGSSVPLPLRREYEVYRRLHGSRVPVAEPLWFDEGIEFADGRPHMVRRLVDGSTNIPGLSDQTPDGVTLRRKVAFETMEKLAIVHEVDWQALGLGDVLTVPPSAAEALRVELEQWRVFWNDKREDADPVMEEALCWLAENVPTDTPRVSLVKGNNGIGEEIWRDGEIVAMSDWELASLGDGALDIGFSQGTMQLGDFDEILGHYARCSGDLMSPERLAFSGFLIWLKQIVCIRSNMLRLYREGKSRRIIGVSLGLVYAETARDRLASCIGKDLVAVWRDVVRGEYNIYSTFGGAKK